VHANLYLGVDGGFSGTRALVIDAEARVRGYGVGGNANHAAADYHVAIAHVADAVRGACTQAGIALSALAFAHFALAGDDVSDDHARLLEELGAAFPDLHLTLSNDVWAGLRAGSISGIGVAVNCGSGCGAVGRDAGGRQLMIPDLGYIFGDSGGGGQIGRDAFRAVIRAWDGRGAPTALTDAVLDLAGQPSVGELYLALYRELIPRDTFRAAARLVLRAAATGDRVARDILERLGDELGLSGAAIARRLEMADTAFTFVLTGGVFRTLDSVLAGAAIARMRSVAPRCQPALPLILPVAGAALLALDGAGRPVAERHYAALREQGYSWHPEERYS
jgi:N-acetylglucosamine kinase-like BadF-type ATPase